MKKISFVIVLILLSNGFSFAQKSDKSPLFNTTFTNLGTSTSYTLLSNGTPQNFYQNPNNPNRIHACCIYNPPADTINFSNRRARYYYSANRGQTWSFIGNISENNTGYASITCFPAGNALISSFYGNSTRWYIDAAEGLGSFTSLYPPNSDYIWPKTATTNNLSNTTKFVSVCSPSGRDSCFWIGCSGMSPVPGSFSPWYFFNSDNEEAYSIARGADGRYGIIYRVNGVLFPNDYGSVYYMESTDDGISFGTPTKIFNGNFGIGGDSVGAFKAMQLIYQGNVPKAVFETGKQLNSSPYSSYLNDRKNRIRFWSSNLPGSDPNRSIILSDTSTVGYHPYVSNNSNHIFSCISKATIGVSIDGTGLFSAFSVPNNIIKGSDTISYMDIWLTYSLNYGLNWTTQVKINPETPLKDWTFPSMSPTNDNTTSNYYVNLLVLSDTLPGSQYSYPNPNYVFARVEIPRSIPSAPVLMSPPNGLQNQPRNPNMKWYPVTDAATYRLQFALDLLFTTPIFDSANIIQTNLQLPQNFLSPGINIYWRVCATNSSGTSPWSPIWNFKTDTVPYYSVSGIVRYKDNNQPVAGGYVKAMKINTSTLDIITMDSAIIQSNGTYVLPSVRKDADYYISPYPNSVPPSDNFVPTYYPSEILWERATPVNVNSNLTNIDINVYRTMDTIGYNTIIGQILKNSNTPLNDAVVYAKKDENFHRFSISNSYGQYALNNLLSATYKIYFSRLGYKSDSMSVTLTNIQYLNSINHTMIPYYVGIKNNENPVPTSYRLYQNYPNPFNPVTRIKFDIPKISDVTIKIYDVTGREIAKLFNSKLQPGKYELTWNASQFSSGLYFIRIEANSFSDTKKIVLIK
jgi:hypothetical protein